MLDPGTKAATSREALATLVRRGRALRAEAARRDPNEFCAFVLRDEKKGRGVVQARHHTEMQRIWSEHRESVVWACPESGKSNQIVGRVLWELGHNPYLRVVFVSKTTDQSEKLLQLCKQYIEHSDELHEVFPNLRRSTDRTLPNHRRAFTAERDSYAIKDPSIRVTGLGGNILGARVDLIVMDDWLDFLSTRTESPRQSAFGWARSNNCFGRLTDGGRIWVVTNAWHPQDANERLVTEAGFFAARFPSMTAMPDQGGVPTYPERWGLERLMHEIRKLGPIEFVRAHLCKPRDDGSQVFRREWFEACMKRGEQAGIFASLAGFLDDARASDGEEAVGRAYQDALDAGGSRGAAIMAAQLVMAELGGRDGAPIAILHGVDLAVEQHSASDLSAIFTLAVYANGDRRVLRIVSGRWDAPKIISEVESAYFAFGGMFIVENAGQQGLLIQMTRASTAVPVRGFRTGTTKDHPQLGIQAVAAEVYSKKWIIPSRRPNDDPEAPYIAANAEVESWMNDALSYDPTAHTGDRLMGSYFAFLGALELQGERVPGLDGAPTASARTPDTYALPPARGERIWILPFSDEPAAIDALEQTIQSLPGATTWAFTRGLRGARTFQREDRFCLMEGGDDARFIKFACEKQGYVARVEIERATPEEPIRSPIVIQPGPPRFSPAARRP